MALSKQTSENPLQLVARLLQDPTIQYLDVLWRVDSTNSEGLWVIAPPSQFEKIITYDNPKRAAPYSFSSTHTQRG